MNQPSIVVMAKIEEELGPMVANHQEYEALFKAIRSGEHAQDIVPSVLPRMIRQESWMRRYDRNLGKPYLLNAHEFIRFIEEKPPVGLGTTLNNVRRYLGEGNSHRAAFEEAVDRGRGGANNPFGWVGKPKESINPNNVRVDSDGDSPVLPMASRPERDRSKEPQAGNAYGYAVRRLNTAAENEPERYGPIRDSLVSGKISANKAMIEAEFRHPTISVPVDPQLATQMLVRHFKGQALADLVRRLADWAGIELVEPQEFTS